MANLNINPMERQNQPPLVVIVTWCKSPDTLYGNSLVFESIRTGFPDSRVVVIDNASEPAMRKKLAGLAANAGCQFVTPQYEAKHWQILDQIAMRESIPENAVCFVDPDVVFWGRVDKWQLGDALMAGRLIPGFQDEYTKTATQPRLHTSFLWLPDVAAFRSCIAEIRGTRFEFEPFMPAMLPLAGEWVRWDCAASLYDVIPRAHSFSEAELDCYDHLFCGTHAAIVGAAIDNPKYAQIHEHVKGGGRDIRGIWRMQEEHFNRRPLKNPAMRAAHMSRAVACY